MKYFHELTKKEFLKLVGKITWEELAKLHPQPPWCQYPNAIEGFMGCWSLMKFMVKNEEYCKKCDCHKSHKAFSKTG